VYEVIRRRTLNTDGGRGVCASLVRRSIPPRVTGETCRGAARSSQEPGGLKPRRSTPQVTRPDVPVAAMELRVPRSDLPVAGMELRFTPSDLHGDSDGATGSSVGGDSWVERGCGFLSSHHGNRRVELRFAPVRLTFGRNGLAVGRMQPRSGRLRLTVGAIWFRSGRFDVTAGSEELPVGLR
jgi:hypothetical protein